MLTCDVNKTYVFCVNLTGLILAGWLKEKGIEVQYLDNDMSKWNQNIIGNICISPVDADNSERCIIAAESAHNKCMIREQLENLGFSEIVDVDEKWKEEWVYNYAPQMNDELYIKIFWYYKMGYNLNLSEPITFNEKIQWLKLYDRNPTYTMMADKYTVKTWVKEQIGEKYVIPTYGIYDSFQEIDFSTLPNSFVIKATHDSGSAIICEDKSLIDIKEIEKKMNQSISRSKFFPEREFSYRDIKPRIIVEKFLGQTQEDITDYKFMCFDGECKLCFTCTERNSQDGLKVTFFDLNWNKLPFTRDYPNAEKEIPKPEQLENMVLLAEKLSAGIPFVRVDLYEIEGEIFFGEMTFYPGSGYEKFSPPEWDTIIGEWIKII